MERKPKSLSDAIHLLQLSELLTTSVRTVIDEWAKETYSPTSGIGTSQSIDGGTPHILPSHTLHEAQRTILAIAGSLVELVSEPHSRIIELACQYWESRALYIVAERRIPDILAAAGDAGVSAAELGEKTGIESLKLCMFSAFCTLYESLHWYTNVVGLEQRGSYAVYAPAMSSERSPLMYLPITVYLLHSFTTSHSGHTSCFCKYLTITPDSCLIIY